jgi:hypothetical protein
MDEPVKVRKTRKDKGTRRPRLQFAEPQFPYSIRLVRGRKVEEIDAMHWSLQDGFLRINAGPTTRFIRMTEVEEFEVTQYYQVPQQPTWYQTWGTVTNTTSPYANSAGTGNVSLTSMPVPPPEPPMAANPVLAARREAAYAAGAPLPERGPGDPTPANPNKNRRLPSGNRPVPLTEIVGENGEREVVTASMS